MKAAHRINGEHCFSIFVLAVRPINVATNDQVFWLSIVAVACERIVTQWESPTAFGFFLRLLRLRTGIQENGYYHKEGNCPRRQRHNLWMRWIYRVFFLCCYWSLRVFTICCTRLVRAEKVHYDSSYSFTQPSRHNRGLKGKRNYS